MYRIEIQEQEDRSDQAIARINGKVYRITRGVEVVVPASVVECFRNGVTDIVEQKDGGGKLLVRRKKTEVMSILGVFEE